MALAISAANRNPCRYVVGAFGRILVWDPKELVGSRLSLAIEQEWRQ